MRKLVQRSGSSRPVHLFIDALNLSRGGGVIVMSRIALAFVTSGYSVTVITARNLPNIDFLENGVKIVVEPNADGAARAILYRKFRLNSKAKEIQADVLLGFNYYSHVALPQATYHINVIPFLDFSIRRSAVGFWRAVLQSLMAKTALRASTANIFESEHVYSIAAQGRTAIRNPIVSYIGAEFPSQLPVNIKMKRSGPFVTVTSGARHKRNDLTLEFFRRVLVKDPNSRLSIIGDSAAIRSSLSLKDRMFVDMSPAVKLHGYVGRTELYQLLAESKALISFSELESFFMIGIEAMSVGCPVIAADSSSIRESLGAAGRVVPAGNVDAAVAEAQDLNSIKVYSRYSSMGRDWASAFEANKCARDFVYAFEGALRLDP